MRTGCYLGLLARGVILLAGLAAARAQAPGVPSSDGTTAPVRLDLTTPARLVDCAPVTQIACMSARYTPVDREGRPAPIVLPSIAKLAAAFTMKAQTAGSSDGAEVKPFYASSGIGADAADHSNVVLLLVDISGSMNEPAPGGLTRIGAIKSALAQYIDGMQENTDRVAILPFESHNVVPTIRAAVFATRKADALAQLNALPAPGPKANTALFQAVFSGVDALRAELDDLERQGHPVAGMRPHLIVMTDGKNEVGPGDDPLLLNGPLGLQQAASQVQTSRLDVIGIGFGDREAIDAAALTRMSTRFYYAADAADLLNALHTSRSAQSHQIEITWMLNESTRNGLTGRDQAWIPTMQLDGLPALTGPMAMHIMPASAAPLYERHATPAELQTLITLHPAANAGWSDVVVHVLLAAAAALLLLVLWFWIPRLVWGERYLNEVPQANRWGAERSSVTAASGVQIRSTSGHPAGFDTQAAASPIQRSATQTTQVGPRGELSRTRLTYDPK